MSQPIQASWPFVPTYPTFTVTKTKGAYLYLEDGTKILDAAGGTIISNIGYGRESVANAMAETSKTNSFVVSVMKTPEREALLHELRTHWLPAHLPRIAFTSSGSEANEMAVRMAILYHATKDKADKRVILSRTISYHGATRATTGWSGHETRKKGMERVLETNPMIETPYLLRCLSTTPQEATEYYLADLKQTIKEVGANNIAALLAEPICGSSGGALTPPPDYWPRVQELLRANDILLICDEVMTGFGRVGETSASKLYGITSDLLTGGKGMAGGYAAINGVFGTDEIAATLEQSGFAPNYGTHAALPMSCTAANSVLQIMRDEDLVQRSKTIGAKLKQRLIDELGDHPNVAEIRGQGMLIGIEFVKDKETLTPFSPEHRFTDMILLGGFRYGVFFYPGGNGPVRDVILLGPAFIIGEPEIDLIVNALKASLTEALSYMP